MIAKLKLKGIDGRAPPEVDSYCRGGRTFYKLELYSDFFLLYRTINSTLSTSFLYRIMIIKLKFRKSFLFLTTFTMFPDKSFRTCASILIDTIHARGTVGTIVRETIVDLCKTGYQRNYAIGCLVLPSCKLYPS